MYRGTTPTLRIKVEGIEVNLLTSIFLTIKQGKYELTKTEADITKNVQENRLDVELTQEETLAFNDGNVNIQLRSILANEKVVASNIQTVPINHILRDGEITNDYS